ncbi:unnamed protein product [Peronospora belbahrii]|uniref:non-specific serine/threonine protein kinase n=1 Tax=Peronospora belbahrii TaxID=622444 RepID=A0AAU9KJW5_9STRA|nr:unnamed protein product [Peronospora belbahrii]
MQRFEELRCIGRGSYGSAHLVQERTCVENRFVIKKIPMELLSLKEKDQSFREVELLAKLKHPNVVEYKENFVINNVLHIVMAYCDGGDLADKIKEQQKIREQIVGSNNNMNDPRGYFPISQVLDWFVQMAMAIKYLHDQRILHRDLKTSNVFLTTDNVVKLGDFGIAKTLDSTLDQAKTVVGTPYYMSPEVCESKPYSYASDVWSLGCVLYEILALRHAFDAPNILTLILKIVQQDCAQVPPFYDKEVSNLLRKLLDKDPEKRPTMDEIFAMPYICYHMQGLVASGGSLKVKVINRAARTPQHVSASLIGRRRLHPNNNLSAQRSSREKRQLRLDQTTSSQVAQVLPMQWMPIKPFTEYADDPDIRSECELLDTSVLEESSQSFRLPERSSTPEPLVITIEEKPHPFAMKTHRFLPDEGIDEELPISIPTAVRPHPLLVCGNGKLIAWSQDEKPHVNGGSHSNSNEGVDDDNDDNLRFQAEAEELMNPNFQTEYSEECIDSLQIYYSSKESTGPSMQVVRQRDNLRQRDAGSPRMHIDLPKSCWLHPAARAVSLEGNEDLLEPSTMLLDDVGSDGTDRAPSLSESSMMRELELDADSDDDDGSTDTSLSEYEVEENFYSYSSSDFEDQNGTQYSDDYEDADAEVIEYADDGFISEGERHENEHPMHTTGEEKEGVATDWKDFENTIAGYKPTGHDDWHGACVPKLEGPTEAQWVMRKVAQSLMLTKNDLYPL